MYTCLCFIGYRRVLSDNAALCCRKSKANFFFFLDNPLFWSPLCWSEQSRWNESGGCFFSRSATVCLKNSFKVSPELLIGWSLPQISFGIFPVKYRCVLPFLNFSFWLFFFFFFQMLPWSSVMTCFPSAVKIGPQLINKQCSQQPWHLHPCCSSESSSQPPVFQHAPIHFILYVWHCEGTRQTRQKENRSERS